MLQNQKVTEETTARRSPAAWNNPQIDADFDNLRRWIVSRLNGTGGDRLEWRILLAEDDAANRHVLTRLLERSGVTVTAVEDGRKAVAAVTTGAFDMVLMDINMPEMDGLTATRTIRGLGAEHGGLPIVAVTSEVSEADLTKMRAAGFDGCLEKPVRRDDLFRVILAALSPRLETAGGDD